MFQNLFQYVNIFIFIFLGGMGIKAGFSVNFMKAALILVFLIFFSSVFSKISLGIIPGITNYIWVLAITFGIGRCLKWGWSNLLGDRF